MSLTPMITEAEKQRVSDCDKTEQFTRSKVGKRKANYEYTDIDTEMVISAEEYTKRYF